MRTQAAILWEARTEWKVEDIELDPPRSGEVLVRASAAGLCHSEEHHLTGDVPFAAPMIGGHEGAGYVEAIGPGVTLVKPGDFAAFSSIPNCGRCPSCAEGRQNLVAPMPGKVIRVLVAQGDEVAVGQGVVVVEAMKMQNEIKSPKAGIVVEVRVTAGATVNANQVLAVVE